LFSPFTFTTSEEFVEVYLNDAVHGS
jgi:hypothetical protein